MIVIHRRWTYVFAFDVAQVLTDSADVTPRCDRYEYPRGVHPPFAIRNAIISAIISTCRRRVPSYRVFRMDVPCLLLLTTGLGDNRLAPLLTHHSILIADPWSPCLPRTHEPRTGRRPVSFAGKRWGIDFPVVAAAPPRYHLVALLLHEPPSNELHTTLRLSQSAFPRRSGAGGAITSRMNTYKTFVRLANGNDFCQPDLAARVP